MDLKDIVQNKRFSTRRFLKHEPLNPAEVRDVLNNALLAPSTGNLQPFRSYVVNDPKVIQTIAKRATNQSWVGDAAVIFVICHVPQESEKSFGDSGYQYSIQDSAIFCTYLDLFCQTYGWGTCWVGKLNIDELKKIVEIPIGIIPLNLLVVGKPYPDSPKTRWPRKTIEQITS